MNNRCIVFVEPWKVELRSEHFDEKDFGPEEVIVENKYTLISPGTELACLAGIQNGFKMPGLAGYISVGQVTACGKNATCVREGDTVFHYRNHTQWHKIRVCEEFCLKVPSDLKETDALFTRMASIAITALQVSDIELGDFVAVVGMGMVGNFAAQLARLQGGRVIAIDVNQQRLQKVQQCGVAHTAQMNPDIGKKIMDFTGGEGVSTFIEATGLSSVLADILPIIANRGEVILLGSPRHEYQSNLTKLLNHIHLAPRLIQIKGAHEFRYPVKQNSFVKHSIERSTKKIFDLIKSGELVIEPLLTHILKPEEAQKAYDGLRDHKDEFMGVVFDWTI